MKSSVKKILENKFVLGQFEARVHEKQQVAFPKKFREALGDNLIVTKGFDHNLVITAEKDWDNLVNVSEGILFTNSETREVQRFFLGNAMSVELDSQGRFVLPEYLRVYADITKDVVFVGLKNFVEAWDKSKWDEQQNQISQNISHITENLSPTKNKNG